MHANLRIKSTDGKAGDVGQRERERDRQTRVYFSPVIRFKRVIRHEMRTFRMVATNVAYAMRRADPMTEQDHLPAVSIPIITAGGRALMP